MKSGFRKDRYFKIKCISEPVEMILEEWRSITSQKQQVEGEKGKRTRRKKNNRPTKERGKAEKWSKIIRSGFFSSILWKYQFCLICHRRNPQSSHHHYPCNVVVFISISLIIAFYIVYLLVIIALSPLPGFAAIVSAGLCGAFCKQFRVYFATSFLFFSFALSFFSRYLLPSCSLNSLQDC